jgi:phosphoribosylanthranilate isomerase
VKRIFVKICGITCPEDAQLAADAGADAVGFVFWPKSPRRVDATTARRIGDTLPPSVVRVGVFVDAPREELARTADEAGLDLLQLHGSETPEALVDLPRRVLKAVRVASDFTPQTALQYEGRAAGLLLDTHREGTPGGTGETFDWSLVREVRRRATFLVLAGGLRPDNVKAALQAVGPDGVDVSSGVERAPGRKDASKVKAFVDAVRSVEA